MRGFDACREIKTLIKESLKIFEIIKYYTDLHNFRHYNKNFFDIINLSSNLY